MIYLNNGATSWPKPPAVSEAVQACLSGTPASQFRGGSSIMKKMWKYFAGKNWDSSLESGKQREYFYIRGNRKHEYSPWGAGLR